MTGIELLGCMLALMVGPFVLPAVPIGLGVWLAERTAAKEERC